MERYPLSRALFERARSVFPGGHHLSGTPLVDSSRTPGYFVRGKGCRLWDVDGHEYVDFLMAFGAIVLGYADDEVDDAAFAQVSQGSLLSLNHPLHLEFVDALLAWFPAAEMALFLKTGSEATTAALRIARRATGRRKIARCGYHGWHDWCLPLEDCVPRGLASEILEFSDVQSLEALFDANPGDIAAVVLAPEMVLPHEPRVFHAIAELARRRGTVFILDEVKTAFRTDPGSIQERLGLRPDLTTVSKALGNGWPIAAVVGRRDVMSSAAGLHLSATYHGETGAMAAALATMAVLKRDAVTSHVWKLGQRLIDGLNEAAARHGVPAVAYGEPLPPMPFLRFDVAEAASRAAVVATFYTEVLARGVVLHPRHLWFVTRAHRERDIDRTLDVCDLAFSRVRDLLDAPAQATPRRVEPAR